MEPPFTIVPSLYIFRRLVPVSILLLTMKDGQGLPLRSFAETDPGRFTLQ